MTQTPWTDEVRQTANRVRRRVLEHTVLHNGGYMSQACSSAEILSTLYLKVMDLAPLESPLRPKPFPGVPSRDNKLYFTGAAFNGNPLSHHDRFFLSPAHYALVLYALLIETKRMAPEGLEQFNLDRTTVGLEQFNLDGSSVEMIGAEHSPGMETTAGSLGQCLSQAAGTALARRLKRDTGRTWVFMSDGEFQIGQTWEAVQAAAFHRLDRLGVFVDVNRQQCDGPTATVMQIEPLNARLESFGWRVKRVDGHDPETLLAAASGEPDGRPLVVLCDTDPCRGLPLLRANAPKLHYLRFKSEDERATYRRALEAL
jgi:transketolase